MRLKVAASALLVLTSCRTTGKDINKLHGDRFTGKPAMVDVMPNPEPVAKRPPKDIAEPKTQPARPETGEIVLPVHIEKRFGQDFKKAPFFITSVDRQLWLDGKGNAFISDKAGTEIAKGKLIELVKDDKIAIEASDGTQHTYYSDGLPGFGQAIIDAPEKEK